MKAIYTMLLQPDDEAGYIVTVPDVDGCITSGETFGEAVAMGKDALCGCLLTYEDRGIEIRRPRAVDEIEREADEIPVCVEIDTVEYRRMTDTKAVRKNVSMPAWLASLAEARNLNLSQVLQAALRKELGVE